MWPDITSQAGMLSTMNQFQRMSKEDGKRWRDTLTKPQSSDQFRDVVYSLDRITTSADLFCNNAIRFLTEAMTLVELASHEPVDQICLAEINENWPDAYVWIRGNKIAVEITSIFAPGRKVGAEYSAGGVAKRETISEWIATAAQVPSALRNGLLKKAAKRYAGEFGLLVYLNLDEYGVRQAEVEIEITKAKIKFGKQFAPLWILWKDKLL